MPMSDHGVTCKPRGVTWMLALLLILLRRWETLHSRTLPAKKLAPVTRGPNSLNRTPHRRTLLQSGHDKTQKLSISPGTIDQEIPYGTSSRYRVFGKLLFKQNEDASLKKDHSVKYHIQNNKFYRLLEYSCAQS